MRTRDAVKHLDWALRCGAIRSWTDACGGQRYVVVTNDGKPHTWSGCQVAAFYAGYCAGRSATLVGAS